MEILTPTITEPKIDTTKLNLQRSEIEGVRIGIRKDGKKYTVRDDRSRYFWPKEWLLFFDNLKEDQKYIFDCLINTGARIDEALHIVPEDFDFERNNLTLRVTKTKAKKGESVGKKRTFTISSQFSKRSKAYIKDNNIEKGQPLINVKSLSVYTLLKRTLKKSGFKDVEQFSLHNIRKTHGNYLKALGVPSDEICYRLGHDMDTFIRHYGSPNIFTLDDKRLMIKILGDVYGLK